MMFLLGFSSSAKVNSSCCHFLQPTDVSIKINDETKKIYRIGTIVAKRSSMKIKCVLPPLHTHPSNVCRSISFHPWLIFFSFFPFYPHHTNLMYHHACTSKSCQDNAIYLQHGRDVSTLKGIETRPLLHRIHRQRHMLINAIVES